jgi:hypothetical protein
MTRTRARLLPAWSFTLSALAIVVVCAALVRSHLFRLDPGVASWGVTFDLTITIPAIYWLVVVRSGRARLLTIAPVFVACAAVAAAIVPRDQQAFLHQLRLVAAPLDIISIALVVRKLVELRRSGTAASEDAVVRIQRAARAMFGDGLAATALASELSVGYYALFCWRKKLAVPQGARAVTTHEQSGWGSVVACILVLFASESIGMHLLVQLWSAKAAWIVTALDLYGMLWLIGDYHALRLRPTLIRSDSIEVRHGLRWHVTVDLANIASIEPVACEQQWKRRKTLKVALLDEPRFIVRLREPVVANGLAGMSKTIDSIAIRPDDAGAFEQLLATPSVIA